MRYLTINEMEQGTCGMAASEAESLCALGVAGAAAYAAPLLGIPGAGWGAFGAALCIGMIADLVCRGWWD